MSFGQWIGLICLVISLYIIWQVSHVLLLVFAAIVLAIPLNKLARKLQDFGIKRLWAVLILVSILLLATILFFLLIVPPFIQEFQQLIRVLPQGFAKVNEWIDHLINQIPSKVKPYIPEEDSLIAQVQPFINRILGRSVTFVTQSFEIGLEFLFVLVLMIMMLVNPGAYRQGFIRLFPSFYRRRANEILALCEVGLDRWFGAALISMSVIALLSWICLSILGIKLAIAQAIITGLLNFIPNVGPTISVVLPMVIALLDAPWKSGVILILYLIIEQFKSNFLHPYIMSKQVSLLPAVSLVSQVFFTIFFGFLGLLLSLPLTVITQIWVQEALIKDIFDPWDKEDVKISHDVQNFSTSVYPSIPEQNLTENQESISSG